MVSSKTTKQIQDDMLEMISIFFDPNFPVFLINSEQHLPSQTIRPKPGKI